MSANNWSPDPQLVPALTARGLYQRLHWAISTLRQYGVMVPDGSRASKALLFLESLADEGSSGARPGKRIDFDWFVARQRTALELFLIALAMTRCRNADSPFTREKLRRVVRGPELKEGRDTSARNIQFELVTAARFALGGVSVRDGEPDLVISFGLEPLGIAAKRLTSLEDSQIRKRVHEAIRQIERTRYRGIVALNLEGHLGPVPNNAGRAEILEAADRAYEIVAKLARESVNNSRVLGMIAFDSLIRPSSIPSPNGYGSVDATTPIRYWISGNILDQIAGTQFLASWRDRWLAALSQLLGDFVVENP
jgi:hypothetical protein